MCTKIITLFYIAAVVFTVVLGTKVNDCPTSTAPQPIFVDINGCTKQPCPLVRGEDAVIMMNFTSPVAINTLKVDVMARPIETASWVPVPIDKNVCDNLINTNCPLEENELAVYKMIMPILKFYPRVNLLMQFSIKHNGGKDDLLCFSAYSTIMDKS